MTRRHEVLSDLVKAIAETEECSPHNLEYSLYEYIETDAIATLVGSKHTAWELTFQVPDHTVVVRGNGQILRDDNLVQDLNLQTN
jgi:hypothetical protein